MSAAIQPVAMPKMGIEMVEGTIAGWKKSVGDAVAAGDEVVEIESDKIINVWESPAAGVLRRPATRAASMPARAHRTHVEHHLDLARTLEHQRRIEALALGQRA